MFRQVFKLNIFFRIVRARQKGAVDAVTDGTGTDIRFMAYLSYKVSRMYQ